MVDSGSTYYFFREGIPIVYTSYWEGKLPKLCSETLFYYFEIVTSCDWVFRKFEDFQSLYFVESF